MIKKLFTLGLAFAAFAANAQQFKFTKAVRATVANTQRINNPVGNTQSTTTSTLVPSSMLDSTCGATLSYYRFDRVSPIDTGYIFGSNSYIVVQGGVNYLVSGNQSAQKYNVSGSTITVSGFLIQTPKASSSAATTSITATIYSEDPTTLGPNVSLGTASKSLNSFTTTGINLISFSSPVSIPAGNFFASVTTPTLGGTTHDTIAIASTQFGCSSADSLSWYYTSVSTGGVVIPTFSGWSSVNSYFGANLDLTIFPIVNITTTGIEKVSKGDLSIYAASPNPASNSININFSVAKPAAVEVQIFDVTGKVVKTIKGNDMLVGKNAISVDLSNLEAGSYLYSINANGNKMFSKFMVTK